MGLVLEHEEPVLFCPVHSGGDTDGAGVDLLALVQVGKQPPLFEDLCADGGDVHERLGAAGGLLRAVDLLPGREVLLIDPSHLAVQNLHGVDVGGEGGVPAVVGPVGVHQPQLSDGGVPALLVAEIVLHEPEVSQIHGETILIQHIPEGRLVHGNKALNGLYRGRRGVILGQGLGLAEARLTALHGVDEVALNLFEVGSGQISHENVDLGGLDPGAFSAGEELDALTGRVGALVVLTGQGLHRQQNVGAAQVGHGLVVNGVALGL